MNNKTIIEFCFRIIRRIMEISECDISLGLRPRRYPANRVSFDLNSQISRKDRSDSASRVSGCVVLKAAIRSGNNQNFQLNIHKIFLFKLLRRSFKESHDKKPSNGKRDRTCNALCVMHPPFFLLRIMTLLRTLLGFATGSAIICSVFSYYFLLLFLSFLS